MQFHSSFVLGFVFFGQAFIGSHSLAQVFTADEVVRICPDLRQLADATGTGVVVVENDDGRRIEVEDGRYSVFESNGDLVYSAEDRQACLELAINAGREEPNADRLRVQRSEFSTPYLLDAVDGNTIARANFCAAGRTGAAGQDNLTQGLEQLAESGDERMQQLAENLVGLAQEILNQQLPGADLGELTDTDCSEVDICSLGNNIAVEQINIDDVVTYNNERYIQVEVLQGPCRGRTGYVAQSDLAGW